MSKNMMIMTKYPPSIKPIVNEEYENNMKKNRISMARKKSSFVKNIMEEKSKISMSDYMQENNKKFLEMLTKNSKKELLEIDEELNIIMEKVNKMISDINKNNLS